jgi:hypothetical protein
VIITTRVTTGSGVFTIESLSSRYPNKRSDFRYRSIGSTQRDRQRKGDRERETHPGAAAFDVVLADGLPLLIRVLVPRVPPPCSSSSSYTSVILTYTHTHTIEGKKQYTVMRRRIPGNHDFIKGGVSERDQSQDLLTDIPT